MSLSLVQKAALSAGVLLVAGVLGVTLAAPQGPGVFEGDLALPVEGTTTGGARVSTEDFAGQVVLLDFWATWCPPCVAKVPELIALQERYGPQGFRIVGISADQSLSELQTFELSRGINYPTIFGGAAQVIDAWTITGFPTMVLVDRGGIIRFRGHFGDIEGEIVAALGDKETVSP